MEPVQISNVVLMILEQVPDSGVTTKVSFRGHGGGGLGVSSMPTTVHTWSVCQHITYIYIHTGTYNQ